MTDQVQRQTLDAAPTPEQIDAYREEAAEQSHSVEVTFPVGDDTKRLVVSPRGTVVLLNDTSEETFNRSVSAQDIAAALPE